MLGYVRQFMGKNACEFFFLFHVHDEAGEHVDVATGNGKGVERIVQDNGGFEIKGLRRNLLDQTVYDLVDVLAHLWVFHNGHVCADHHVKLVAHLFFVLDGDAAEKEGLGRYGHKLG